MPIFSKKQCLLTFTLLFSLTSLAGESKGLAPKIQVFNAQDSSYYLEKTIPDLKKAFIDSSPAARKDGLRVGRLGIDGGNKSKVLKIAQEIADNKHDLYDSMLISYQGKLIFESYYSRGRIDLPHFQMSATKSYTALAVGRAIHLGYLTMADLDKPVVNFLKELDPKKFAQGIDNITLHKAMTMRSGLRINWSKIEELEKSPEQLKGQGLIQAYF
jgi:hypothetical protein